MKKAGICLMMLMLITACSDKNKVPKDILSMKKMETVLSDILLADALNIDRCARDTSLKLQKENASYFLRIYKMHNIDSTVFNRSYDFYSQRPDLLKEISDTVIAVLNRNTTKPVDSLKKIRNGNHIKKDAR